MRIRFVLAGLVAIAGAAHAQDNPACAKYTNDFEYNACLAKLGPKAAATRPGAEPTGGDHGGQVVTRGKHGRMSAVFDLGAKK